MSKEIIYKGDKVYYDGEVFDRKSIERRNKNISPQRLRLANYICEILSNKERGNKIIEEFINSFPHFKSFGDDLDKAPFYTDMEIVFFRSEAVCRIAYENLKRRLKGTGLTVNIDISEPYEEDGEIKTDASTGYWYLWFQ